MSSSTVYGLHTKYKQVSRPLCGETRPCTGDGPQATALTLTLAMQQVLNKPSNSSEMPFILSAKEGLLYVFSI